MNSSSRSSRPKRTSYKTTGRPKTACDQCSELKVRCAGERPSCCRCSRLRRRCTWTNSSAKRLIRDNRTSTFSRANAGNRTRTALVECGSTDVGIPTDLLDKLVDLYFSRAYNATLLLHRPSFAQSLASGTASKHVVLSVCALSSCFHEDRSQYYAELGQGFAHAWAEEAGRLVFSQTETPTEENIVTFLNLAMFWYSQGRWQRVLVHESNAVCTVRVLGLGFNAETTENSLAAELSRRRLWACFLVNQFTYGFGSGLSHRMNILDLAAVDLPCDEDYFESSSFSAEYFFCGYKPRTSIFAELIRLTSIWSLVCDLVHNDTMEADQKLLSIQKLDRKLKSWRADLPDIFEIDGARGSSSIHPERMLTLHIVYHQAVCTLHSCIIPLFSLNPIAADLRGYFQSSSAQTALFHGRQISDILLRLKLRNLSHQPMSVAFIGYAAYCSSAIQLPFLWCLNSCVRKSAQANIKVNLEAMRSAGKQWKLVAALTEYMPILYNYHKAMAYSPVDEPRVLNEADLNQCNGAQSLARASILGYNKIIMYKGKLARDGEFPCLDLGFIGEAGLVNEPFADSGSPLSAVSAADLVYTALSGEGSLGSSEFQYENSAPLPVTSVAAENMLSSESLSVLQDIDFLRFNTMLDWLNVPCVPEEMPEDGSTALAA